MHPRLCVPGWRRAGCFRPEPNVLFIGAYSTYSKHTKFPLVITAFISIINSFISHYNLVTINSSACWQHPKSKPHVEMNTNVVWFPRRPISLTHQVEQLKLWEKKTVLIACQVWGNHSNWKMSEESWKKKKRQKERQKARNFANAP